MHMSGTDPLRATVAYADYLCDSFGLYDQATSITDQVIAATTQPGQLLQDAYDAKLRAQWKAQRWEESLATCDKYAQAFRDDPTTLTWYRMVVLRSRQLQAYCLARKSLCYERMGQPDKAIEARLASHAISMSFSGPPQRGEAKAFELALVMNNLILAELYERAGRDAEALSCLTDLRAYLAQPSNMLGIADAAHPQEKGLLRAAQSVRDQKLPAAIDRLERKLRGEPDPIGQKDGQGIKGPSPGAGCGCGCGGTTATVAARAATKVTSGTASGSCCTTGCVTTVAAGK
jgi:tetratricopeptide (TPR) repeat protein